LGVLLSVAVYTVGYAVVQMKIYRVKAAGLPWLLNDPLYWLLMNLIVGGEIWLGINKLGSH
jgi:hypothetical protein